MLLFEAPSWPGVVIPAKAIGIVCMTQKKPASKRERNDRIMMLPTSDPRYRNVEELPKRVRQELEQFFVTTSEMTEKKVTIEGWKGPEAADKAIDEAAQQYAHRSPDEQTQLLVDRFRPVEKVARRSST
jgi:inorganic pyrophosphatase